MARRRLQGLFPPDNVWIITSAHYLDQVAAELGDVPRANLIGEPVGRDTANAIGLAAQMIARRDNDATMAVFTADHIINPQERFAAAIGTGLDVAEQHSDSLVTFGIPPRSAHTGYGYIHRGEELAPGVHAVAEFKEKPTEAVAETYVRSGEYLWNSGMFAWRVSAIWAELERLLPKNARALAELATDWSRRAGTNDALTRFGALRKISIDYGVMEKANRVLVVEMNCDWQDLGSWTAIAGTRQADEHGNVIIAPQALVVDCQGNLLVCETDHLLVTLGVSDLVVIHSADATLVCRRDEVERVKDLVRRREARFGARYE